MPRRPFQIANVGSAILWVPTLFAPGYLAARSMGTIAITGTGMLLLAGFSLVLTVLATFIGAAVMGGRRRPDRRGAKRIGASAR